MERMRPGDPYEGFTIDVLSRVADMTEMEFELYEVSPTRPGDPLTQELVDGEADVVGGPYRVNARRENFVDFTTAYFMDDFQLLVQKQGAQRPMDFEPRHMFYWWIELFHDVAFYKIVLPAFFITTLILWLWDLAVGRCDLEAAYHGTSGNCRLFWLIMGPITPPGGTVAMRIIGGLWWFSALLVSVGIAVYFNQPERWTQPIGSLSEALDSGTRVGALEGSEAFAWLQTASDAEGSLYDLVQTVLSRQNQSGLTPAQKSRMAEFTAMIPDTYTMAWRSLQEVDGARPASTEEALRYIRWGYRGKPFALLGSSGLLAHLERENCDTTVVGRPLGGAPLAFAVQQGSPLREPISKALLTLLKDGELERLRAKWFAGLPPCPQRSLAGLSPRDHYAIAVSWKRGLLAGSLAVIVGIALLLSTIAVILHYCCYRQRPLWRHRNGNGKA